MSLPPARWRLKEAAQLAASVLRPDGPFYGRNVQTYWKLKFFKFRKLASQL
jgi:hypothetical protein